MPAGILWRRERDSNPRTVARNTISSRARSTTPPSLRFYDFVVRVDFTDFVILYYSVKKFKYF